MPRSAGVTVSAVIVLIGSGFTVLGGVMVLLASTFIVKSSFGANAPVNLVYVLVIEAAVVLVFGGWGLAAGTGLIYLQRWARISMLVYAAILVVISLPAAVVFAVIPIPNANDPDLASNFATITRIGMVLFYAIFAALGGFWLYFFNRQHVKLQFRGGEQAIESSIAGQTDTRPARPLSITIIGWFLVIGAALTPLFLLLNSVLFPGLQTPLFFLDFFFFGPRALLILTVWMAAQMAAAVGLLKLKNWARLATIGLQCLVLINFVLLAIPANRARFQQVMETMTSSMNTRMPQPVPFLFPMWAGIAASLPIVLVILWFLITEKQSFASAAQEMAHQR